MHGSWSVACLLALLLLILSALGASPLAAEPGSEQPATMARSSSMGESEPAVEKSTGELRLQAFLQAFNSGDPMEMLTYYRKNGTPEFLQRRTEDERRASYGRLFKELGTLLFRGIEDAGSGEMTLVTASEKAGHIVHLRFDLEASPPHRIKGLGIEVGAFRGEEKFPPLDLPEASDEESLAPALDAYLEDLERRDLFSGTVLVARGGRTIFQGAYGSASREPRKANRIDTRFDVGSITKAFTKVAIGQLARNGKLSLDDAILDHIPDYPNREVGRKVTVRHLLDHEGGLGDIFNEKFMSADKETLLSPEDFFTLFAKDDLLFEPGVSRRYSNAGFIILGAIVAAVAGQPYEEYIQEHVFNPARMEGSGFLRRDGSVENVAIGYTRLEGPEGSDELRSNVGMLPVKGCSAGSSSSSAEDLFRFDRALRKGKLLGSAWTKWYFTGSVPESSKDTASGENPPFPEAIGIAGGAPGVNAMLNSDGDDTVVVLTNQDPPAAMEIGEKIWKALDRKELSSRAVSQERRGAFTKIAENGYYPSWTPDGTHIVYGSMGGGPYNIWSAPIAGDKAERLTAEGGYHPAVSPDGKHVTYDDRGAWGTVYRIPLSGGGPIRVTPESMTGNFSNWSPDGSTILFNSGGDIWTVPSAGGEAVRIISKEGHQTRPVFSPDGLKIAFDSADAEGSGNIDIWTYDTAKKTYEKLTNDPGKDMQPHWSPDGTMIAYMSERSGNRDIWVMKADGSAALQVTFDEGMDVWPRWAPDGRRLAYGSERSGSSVDIWVVDLEKQLGRVFSKTDR